MNLKVVRGKMSVRELAQTVGVSQQAIYYYESRKKRPSPEVAEKIASVLGLSIEDIWKMFYAKDAG